MTPNFLTFDGTFTELTPSPFLQAILLLNNSQTSPKEETFAINDKYLLLEGTE